MPKAEPYLLIDDTEVLSSLRTLTYLRRGLDGGGMEVGTTSPLTTESGYSDTYGDSYDADPYWPGNLACFCDLVDVGPYVSPAVDPAPWYDSARPESEDFLGIVADVDIPAVARRAISPRAGGGATIGTRRLGPRLVQVVGIMYAASTQGMAWGEAWLREVLAGPSVGCGEGTLKVLPACPPVDADEPSDYFRELLKAGLADGPTFSPVADVGACLAQEVSFQLAAGSPWLRHPATDCIGLSYLRLDPTLCCTLEGPGLIGDAAAVITVHAGQVGFSASDITVTATWDSSCPSSEDADVTYDIGRIPRGCAAKIDSATGQVTVYRTLTGEVVGGADVLGLTGIVPWVVAAPGEQVCICVDATDATLNAGTLVTVERVEREV